MQSYEINLKIIWISNSPEVDLQFSRILKYFKSYSILGVYPEHISRAIVKKAYKKKAKEIHPDLNKQYHKKGTEFIAVQQAYNYVMEMI